MDRGKVAEEKRAFESKVEEVERMMHAKIRRIIPRYVRGTRMRAHRARGAQGAEHAHPAGDPEHHGVA